MFINALAEIEEATDLIRLRRELWIVFALRIGQVYCGVVYSEKEQDMSNLITRQIRLEAEQVRYIEALAAVKEQTKSQVYRRALSLGIEQLKQQTKKDQ